MNEKMIKYKANEKKLLKAMFSGYTYWNGGEYDVYDYIDDTKEYVVEVKIREFNLDTFTGSTKYNGNPLIEEEKFFNNFLLANEKGYQFIYIYGYLNQEGKIEGYSAFNLQHIPANYFWQKKLLCPKNELDDEIEMVWKDCFIINKRLLNTGNTVTKLFKKPL